MCYTADYENNKNDILYRRNKFLISRFEGEITMAVIGIDLGTTNSLAAVWKDEKVCLISDALGNFIVPSVVAVDMDENILVGYAAREEGILHPERCASNFKRFMGTTKIYRLAGREFTPEELSAIVLKKIKEIAEAFLNEEITEVIISVPAYFNNDQRYATKLAAELAGLYCERMINEPSAAALAARCECRKEEQSMLVFDFGGGTLDVSIVDCFENIVEITAIAGENHLGGADIDEAVALAFCVENEIDFSALTEKEKAELLLEAKRCKEAITFQEEAEMIFFLSGQQYSMILTTEKLLTASQALFRKMKQTVSRALKDAGLRSEDITKVLLAGGSSRMPAVKLFLERLFERELTNEGRPDFFIAEGIGIYTGIKERKEELQDILMTDVCPFSLGIRTAGASDEHDKMYMMIERNNILPCRVSEYFTTARDFQEIIRIEVYQGESYDPDKNLKIGELELEVPKAKKGKEGVQVTFTYNINGLLEVSVVNNSTKKQVKVEMVSGYHQLSKEQFAARKEQLEAMQYLSGEEEEHKTILALAERLFEETVGRTRQSIGILIEYYNCAWNSKSPIRIRQAGREVLQNLLAIEMQLKQFVFEPGMFEEQFEDGEDEK